MSTSGRTVRAGVQLAIAFCLTASSIACRDNGGDASFCETARSSGAALATFPGPDRSPASVQASAGGVLVTADRLVETAPDSVVESARAVASYLHAYVSTIERFGFDLSAASATGTAEERRLLATPPTEDFRHLAAVTKTECGVTLIGG